ncbi:MAG: CoA transferase [Pseudomonadales bacterium]
MSALPTAAPLSGVKVLNCGTAGVGPWAASLLGFLGASVFKIERPGGDFIRLMYPRRNGVGAAYPAFNAGQRVLTLDLKDPVDCERFDELVRDSDVLIENFRPGVAERLHMGYERVRAINPGIVYGSSSAWGDSGPMRDQAAVDPHLQAFSGFAALNGEVGGPPEMLRSVHIDPNGSVYLAALLILGLLQRNRIGTGMRLGTSHFAMALAMQSTRIAELLSQDDVLPRMGSACIASAPNQCVRTADGQYLAVTAESDHQWAGLCRALQRPDWLHDDRFGSNTDRCLNREVLARLLEAEFLRFPQRWWISRLEQENVPHSRLLDYDDLRFHPQILDNAYLSTLDTEEGAVVVGGLPWHFSRTPARLSTAGADESVAQVAASEVSADPEVAPLHELTVIDASEGYSGPLLSLLLADSGATVIKAELPAGDWARHLEPADTAGSSALFEALNRNKRGLPIAPDKANSRTEFDLLLAVADVLVYDANSLLAQQWELSEAALRERYPRLVLVELSAYGPQGPLAASTGSELTAQAMTGYLRNLGRPDGPPVRVGADIATTGTAAMALVGTLAALYERERSGAGQRIQCSLLGTLMSMRSLRWASLDRPDAWRGTDCGATTDNPWLGYQTRDGFIWPSLRTVRENADLQYLLEQLGVPEDMRLAAEMKEMPSETIGLGYLARQWQARWDSVLGKLSRDVVLAQFHSARGIAVEFSELHEIVSHPQTQTLGIFEQSGGRRYMRAPWSAPWSLPPLQLAPTHPKWVGIDVNSEHTKA